MPRTTPRPATAFDDLSDPDTPAAKSRLLGWAVYAAIALVGFCFGVWAGTQRPTRVVEVVTAPPPAPAEKPAPEQTPKKGPVAAATPEPKTPEPKPTPTPPEPKTPEAVTPAPKAPEPKPEPKKPEPKKTPEPKPTPAVTAVSFEKQVRPVLKAKCMLCHGDTKGPKGDLDLRTLATILKGGDSGPGVKPGNLKDSPVWTTIDDGSMPPAGKEPLTAAEKKLIQDWILSGAK